jgi:hypothetical protein
MMGMRSSRARSRLITILALLATVGQLAVTLIAPLADGRAGQSAAAHVEEKGVTLHYAHNEATCVACAATTLVSLPIARRSPLPVHTAVLRPSAPPPHASARATSHTASPRAPPVLA